MDSLKLRPYQEEDVNKLKNFKTCGILSRPRTGKTPTSLILSDKWPAGKTLIVCTGSMLYKWQDEFKRWLNKPCEVYTGTEKQRKEALEHWTDGLVITYDTLKRINHFLKQTEEEKAAGAKKVYSHTTGAIDIIRKYKPTKIIVDEFHRAKGYDTARAHALNLLAKDVPYRVVLTGTPAYSTQLDVYNMLKFLWPEYDDFSTWWKFRQKYVEHDKIWINRNGELKQQEIPVKLNKLGVRLVHQLFAKYCVQRDTADPEVMPWLPKEPIPEIIKLPADKAQAKALKDLEKWFEVENEDVIAKNGLDRITKYRQIISEPRILLENYKGYGPKTNWILNYLKEYIDIPTIYFTNSTKHIKLLLPLMQKITDTACIIGATSLKERAEIEKKFQKGEIKHLICNTQAAQEGLTLDTAETEIFIEQFPPYGSIDQASKRFTPATPEKANIPKRIIKLILEKTYDEAINETINSREKNVNILNNFKKYLRR